MSSITLRKLPNEVESIVTHGKLYINIANTKETIIDLINTLQDSQKPTKQKKAL